AGAARGGQAIQVAPGAGAKAGLSEASGCSGERAGGRGTGVRGDGDQAELSLSGISGEGRCGDLKREGERGRRSPALDRSVPSVKDSSPRRSVPGGQARRGGGIPVLGRARYLLGEV